MCDNVKMLTDLILTLDIYYCERITQLIELTNIIGLQTSTYSSKSSIKR